MAVGDVFQLDVVATAAGEYCEQIYNLNKTTEGDDSDPLMVASGLIAGWIGQVQTDWLNCFSSDYALLGYRCRRIFPIGGPTAFTGTPTTVGSVDGQNDVASIGACLLLSYRDDTTGKFRCGRSFMASAPSGFINSNVLQGAYITALNNLTTTLQAPLNGSDASVYTIGVWSRKRQVFYPAIGEDPPNWYYSGKVGMQRRRLRPAL